MHNIELDEYIELLDKRLGERVQKEYVGIVAKKVRTCGQPSTSKPPIDAPSWAVRKNPEGKNNIIKTKSLKIQWFCYYLGHETAIMALST